MTDANMKEVRHTDAVELAALSEALRNYKQADVDGVMCIVSRQAVEEAADIFADLQFKLARVEAERDRLRAALTDQSMPCTCHEAYSGRRMQDPECRAGEYGDDCREALGLRPFCQHNLRLAGIASTDGELV